MVFHPFRRPAAAAAIALAALGAAATAGEPVWAALLGLIGGAAAILVGWRGHFSRAGRCGNRPPTAGSERWARALLGALPEPMLLLRERADPGRQSGREGAARRMDRRPGRPPRHAPSGHGRAAVARRHAGPAGRADRGGRDRRRGPAVADDRRRPRRTAPGWSISATAAKRSPRSGCGSISSPMPATSCARRWPPCSASSRPCRTTRPRTTRPSARASSG